MLWGSPPLIRPDTPPGADPVRRLLDRWVPWVSHGDPASEQRFGVGPQRVQGWKLHISATALSAPAVLERALPILLAEGVPFKVINSQHGVILLNQGAYGPSQIGKFITVYPFDDVQAVRLAVALDEATRGLAGPVVRSDRQLRPGSLVHYRYGGFHAAGFLQEYIGEHSVEAGAILDPQGRLAPDYRLQEYLPPNGVIDPFEAAGVYVPPEPPSGPLAGRYLILDMIRSSSGGGIYSAIDLRSGPVQLCLIKEACHDVGMDTYGRDACAYAKHEADLLARYSGDPYLPQLYDCFELGGNFYIVMEQIAGKDLNRELNERPDPDAPLPLEALIAIGRAAAEALAHLHEIGLVFRDFSPFNLIHTTDGSYRLVDFAFAYEYRRREHVPYGIGTTPFYSWQQFRGEPPTPADDVFAWGAVIHYLASDRQWVWERQRQGELWHQPFLREPIRSVNGTIPTALAAVIDRALAWERADRYETMGEALAAFTKAAATVSTTPPFYIQVTDCETQASELETAVDVTTSIELARAVGDALCAGAQERPGGLCWPTRNEISVGKRYPPDLYDGTAGIALFLAALAKVTQEQRYADGARAAACWLSGPEWERGRAKPGLYNGEAGIGYFYLRLASLLKEPGYLHMAELRARRLAGVSFRTLDLGHGAAGAAFFLAALAKATGERAYERQGREAGDVLLKTAQPAPAGTRGCYWVVPPSRPGDRSYPYLGLLHGTAGIALALQELAGVTGEERYAAAARSAAELLLQQAVPGPDGGWCWPLRLGDTALTMQALCHGAVGIGRFFLRLSRDYPDPRYLDAACRAALTLRTRTPTHSGLCHGIAGDITLLLDLYRTLGAAQYLEMAQRAAGHFRRFSAAGSPGIYHTKRRGIISPDLMNGYAGIGAVYLRLARPDIEGDPVLL